MLEAARPERTRTLSARQHSGGGEERVSDDIDFVVTNSGPLVLPDGGELPATGKRVEVEGMELVRVRDGKIVVDNLYYDNLAVAAQLGLLPQNVPTTV